MRSLMVVVLAVLVAPGSAGAVAMVDEHGQPAQPYQDWANSSSLVRKRGRIVVSHDLVQFCDLANQPRAVAGCMNGDWLVLDQDVLGKYLQAAMFHEIGHWTDLTVATHKDRHRYCRITGLPCNQWWNQSRPGGIGTGEYFADSFRFCAMFGSYAGYVAAGSSAQADFTYGRPPSARTFDNICSLMRVLAQRKTLRP